MLVSKFSLAAVPPRNHRQPASAVGINESRTDLITWSCIRGATLGLNASDFLVIAGYLAAVTLFGLRFRRRETTLRGYFLADKRISWWAISLSIVAAETSTLTIISVPGLAYEQDFRFLQLIFGYIVGRVIVAFLFVPHYFRGELITAYQFIDRRFGPRLRTLTAGLILVTRAA